MVDKDKRERRPMDAPALAKKHLEKSYSISKSNLIKNMTKLFAGFERCTKIRPSSREGMRVIEFEGRFLVTGGMHINNRFEIWEYLPLKKSWILLNYEGKQIPMLSHHGVAKHGKNLIFIGGFFIIRHQHRQIRFERFGVCSQHDTNEVKSGREKE